MARFDNLLVVDASAPSVGALFHGPDAGELRHDPDADLIEFRYPGLAVRDFVVEARFDNSFDRAEHELDYGFELRDVGGEPHYHFYVRSDGTWVLDLLGAPEVADASSDVRGLYLSADGSNLMRLEVAGPTARFFVNDRFVDTLGVSAVVESGGVAIVTGFQFVEINGDRLRFEDFTVWEAALERVMDFGRGRPLRGEASDR